MSKLVFLAALISAAALNGRSLAQGAVETAPLDPCWSSWRIEFDAELIITEFDSGAREYVAPDTDPCAAGSFTGVGWTFGNLFDDVQDTGYPLGPGDYSNAEWDPPIDLDGHMSFAVSIAS